MNNRQQKTLQCLFDHPVRANIRWADVENLLRALGAEVREGRGSRVSIVLKGAVHSLHKPHPSPELPKYAVTKLRIFLEECEIEP
jgi:hypothetical protein